MNEAVISDPALWKKAEQGDELITDGVFSGGIYFSFPDGTLLMLHDSFYGSLPFGVAVTTFEGQGRRLGIEAGMCAILSDTELAIPDCRVSFPIRFLPHAVPSARIAEHFLKNASPFAAMPDDLFFRAAAPALEKLRLGLEAGDATLLRTAVRGLVGLGKGLTPSYDDYLTGLLFCLHYADKAVPALDRAVLDSLGQTNRYSAAFLRAASEGGYFSVLADCLETGDSDTMQRLLRVGSSSGRDMLAGMCFAVSYLSSGKLA